MIGGRPPRSVEVEECTISDVFSKLSDVKNNLDCQAGCEQGTGACPENWYQSAADECSPACGAVCEPFGSRPQAIASCTAICCLKLSALNRLLRACCRLLQWDQCGEMLVAAGMGGLELGVDVTLPGSDLRYVTVLAVECETEAYEAHLLTHPTIPCAKYTLGPVQRRRTCRPPRVVTSLRLDA